MEKIWLQACAHYDVSEDVARIWYTRINQQLDETNTMRCYHNWNEMMVRKQEHLQHCKPSIVIAAFFQYYHFDGSHSCVKENCAVFEEFCKDALWEDDEAKTLILKLLGNKSMSNGLHVCYENEANTLQDLDLAILAVSPEEYKTYTSMLRQEYDKMSGENYKIMRLKVLETLLLIPNIYSTAEYQSKFEAAARENIKREIAELKG